MDNGLIVWPVHFPIDFKGKGKDNLGAKAMKGLCALIKEHPGSIAFGDMNTIHGEIEDSILSVVPEDMYLDGSTTTFFGSFYDTVLNDEAWQPLM
jgi:hypothetical protein